MTSENSAFHTAIFDALCACLNLSAAEGIKLIHEAYAEPENVPRPARNKNVIYWTVLQDPSSDPISTTWNAGPEQGDGYQRSTNVEPENRPRSSARSAHIPIVYTTLKYNLLIVCYGPACEEYALRIRHMLFLDGFGFPRRILRNAGIYPVPDPPQPFLLHEEEGSLWRKRADLTISLRVREEERGQTRPSITIAPAVIIRKGN